MDFKFALPTQILFGRGRLNDVGVVARSFAERAVLVTGQSSMRRTGVLVRTLDALSAAGVQTVCYEGISPNPNDGEVDEVVRMVVANRAGVVVGLGGGSVLDAAKAVAVAVRFYPAPAARLVGAVLDHHRASLPMIAVPSTAGTGSEVTQGAIIIDRSRRLKSGIRGPDVAPRVAIIDPEISQTVPGSVAAETAFDALTHAIETAVAVRANPIGVLLSEHAVKIIGQVIRQPTAREHVPNRQDQLCLAALIGGINIGTSGSCLPHRIQQAMGSLSHVEASHGRGLAALYPAWLRRTEPVAKGQFARFAALLAGDSADAAGYSLPVVIDEVMNSLGLAGTITTLGVRPGDDVDEIIAHVSGDIQNDPTRPVDGRQVRDFVESAIDSQYAL